MDEADPSGDVRNDLKQDGTNSTIDSDSRYLTFGSSNVIIKDDKTSH